MDIKLTLRHKILISLISITSTLIITNPSYEDFKAYTGDDLNDRIKTTRDKNYFIYSTYTKSYPTLNENYYYRGILGNFFEISKSVSPN